MTTSTRRMLTLTVQHREQISPHFVAVTLGGDDVRHLQRTGYDQAGRLFFATPGQTDVALPTSERWMLQYTLQPARRRPRVRTYTIRRFQGATFRLEIAVHPDGPGTAWALAAEPGERVAFLDEGHTYAPAPGAAWQLLAGDESALPAILAILEHTAGTLPTDAFVEVPTTADIRHEITGVHWLPRDDPALRPGTLALRAVRDAPLRPGPGYAWAAGESSLATGVRRHLVGDRGLPRSAVAFRGYWKHGRASL